MLLKNKNPFTFALILWSMLTVLIAASILFIFLHWGASGFKLFIEQWPLQYLPIALASVIFDWLLLGTLIYLFYIKRVNANNGWGIGGFFLMAFIYLNILSERLRYGDYTYYFEAAADLLKHKPLPDTYLYPPFWATLLQFLVPFGENNFLLVLWIADFLALLLFYILLYRVLNHYGFSARLAAIVTTLF